VKDAHLGQVFRDCSIWFDSMQPKHKIPVHVKSFSLLWGRSCKRDEQVWYVTYGPEKLTAAADTAPGIPTNPGLCITRKDYKRKVPVERCLLWFVNTRTWTSPCRAVLRLTNAFSLNYKPSSCQSLRCGACQRLTKVICCETGT
jgi:hypothetical protein